MRYIISFLLASTAPAWAEVPRVMADLPPVHSLVAQVMGDLGQPELLLDKGANAHSFQMRHSQAAGLQEADLVVWIGPEMTPWLDRALEGISGAGELRLLAAEGTFRQEFDAKDAHDHGHDHGAEAHDAHGEKEEGHADHGHADHGHDDHAEEGHEDHAAEGHDEAGHEGHDHTGLDPHAWLDPANAGHWLGLIAAELSKLDPENAATYAANAAKAQADLAALDQELAATLAPVKDKPLVVYHDAYGYFAGHYGLTIAAALAEGDAAGPGAQHIAEVEALLKAGPVCLFAEANHDPKLVTQLAEATGLTVSGTLDPEGAQLEPGAGLYAEVLRGLAGTIAGCAN